MAALAFRDPRRILKRKDTGQLNIDEVQAQIDVELAKQARAHLGYDATPMLKRAELTRALARLRIEPFTEKTVERYKRRVINNNRPLLFRNPIAHVLGAPAESSSLWPFVFALAATILSFLYGMVGAFFNTPGVVHAWQFAGGAFAWMVFGFLYAGSGGHWESVSMQTFSAEQGEMSKAATHLGTAVAEQLPNAEFSVCRHVKGKGLDPFLVVKHGNAVEHIAVWDERDFRA